MPAKEEARLTALLWRAATDSDQPLAQDDIDGILGVDVHPAVARIPAQRQDGDAWLRIRTDTGDERWLNHIVDRHCRELA